MFTDILLFFNILSLREGIIITVNQCQYKIFFQLVLVAGNNKRLNEILGFSKSCGSGKHCQACSAGIDQRNTLYKERSDLIRMTDSYTRDLKINDSSETGIEEACIYNNVDGFEVWDSLSHDLLHNDIDGRIAYALLRINKCLICKQNYFNLNYLNERKNSVQKKLKLSNFTRDIDQKHITSKEHF